MHNVSCFITAETGATETRVFSVIRCTSDDPLMRTYFMQLMDGILGILGPSPNRQEVTRVIGSLVDLFRALSSPAKETVQGLWAELFLIATSSEPGSLIAAWHMSPSDIYDFSAGDQRIEVKSSGSRSRRHHFSLTQLQPPQNSKLVIASIFAERAGGGTSLDELTTDIKARVSARLDLIVQLDLTIALTLGNSWRGAFEDRYDKEQAWGSLSFYDYGAIPSITGVIPAGVSDIGFRSDLAGIPALGLQELQPLGGIINAAMPFKARGAKGS